MLHILLHYVQGLGKVQGQESTIDIHYGNQILPIAIVSIGTPPQPISMLIQTESNMTWVRYNTDRCSSKTAHSGNTFSPTNSSTFVNLTPVDRNGNEAVQQLNLINGTVDVERIKETLYFGNLDFPNSTLGGACNFDGSSPDLFQYSSGSLGLSPGSSDIHKILDSGKTEKIISLWYNRTSTDGPAGELIVGGIDKSKYIEPLFWIPTQNTDSWSFHIDIGVGDQLLATNQPALVFSGATLVSVPNELFNSMTKNMNLEFVSNQYIFKSCLDTAALQPIKFVIGNNTMILQHYQQFYYNPPSCILNFVPRNESAIVLGSLFLRHFYLAMNYGNASVGFAIPSDNFTVEFQGAATSPFNYVIFILSLVVWIF
ncbi:hypothetical protein HDV06_004981 [Boothiomyces sp. JEL0866]|nr:hypothetical protein HDV06_004948 [Boothiomyces sp. JEL0866]KAJ3325224.1 hypothetical protein HDV06_004981 [Boothiomyces sp. JEL0866]